MTTPRTLFFIHQNIPAQFKHLAPALAAEGHRVVFITNGEGPPPAGVTKVHYKIEPKGGEVFEAQAAHYAGQVARALVELKQHHRLVPDLIIGHVSWGELMFVRDVYPDVPVIGFFEWFHRAATMGHFDPEEQHNPNAPFVYRLKNVPNYVSWDVASAGYTPMQWQRASFPEAMQAKLSVIHDGIDTAALKRPPNPALRLPDGRLLTREQEVITYVARGLEPSRGVRTVLRAVEEVCRRRPNAQVVVIGGEQTAYGNPLTGGGTHKEQLLKELTLDLSRVHFLGRVPYQTFLGALFVSRAHVYFTYPFFLSWSMLEAMAAECLVIGSATAPVEEAIRDGENGLLVGFHDVAKLADRLEEALAHPGRFEDLRRAARQSVIETYDLNGICLPKQKALIHSLL